MTDDVPRRDPRQERDLRRARSGGSVDARAAEEVQAGPHRRDPRAERDLRRTRRMESSGAPSEVALPLTLRRDPRQGRGRRASVPMPSSLPAPTTAPEMLRVPDDLGAWALVVPDAYGGAISTHDRDAIAAARILADALGGGLVAFAPSGAADYGALGIDRVVPSREIECSGDRLVAIETTVDRFRPAHVILPDTPIGGGHIGRQLAVRRRLRAATAVSRVRSGPEVLRRADGGGREQVVAPAAIVLVLPEAATASPGPRREAKLLDPPRSPGRHDVVREGERLPTDPNSVPLSDADLIISAGTGVTDWARFARLAGRLEAAIGCTRAVCDSGHLPRNRQVGASGTLVDPRCYLSFGISGAPQHLQGIARCERVVAVNTDLHAEMIKRAQIAVVADAQAVMAEMLEVLGERT